MEMRVQSCTALENVAARAVTGAHVSPGSFGASLRHASIGIYMKPAVPFTSSGRWSCGTLYRKGRDRPRFVSINSALFPGNVVTDPIVRDALAFVFSAIGATTLVAFFESIRAAGYVDQKMSRKLVHTFAGPLFLVCWPLFSATPRAQYLAALVPAMNGLRLFLIGTGIIKNERAVASVSRSGDPSELLRGPLYYVVVLICVTAFYWRTSPIGVIITSLMCGGDGLADIVGRQFGSSNPLPWNPQKSWAGSLAMFFGGSAMSALLIAYFSVLGYMKLDDIPSTAGAVIAVSAMATLIESLPINKVLDDNLSVPLSAAALGAMLMQLVIFL